MRQSHLFKCALQPKAYVLELIRCRSRIKGPRLPSAPGKRPQHVSSGRGDNDGCQAGGDALAHGSPLWPDDDSGLHLVVDNALDVEHPGLANREGGLAPRFLLAEIGREAGRYQHVVRFGIIVHEDECIAPFASTIAGA